MCFVGSDVAIWFIIFEYEKKSKTYLILKRLTSTVNCTILKYVVLPTTIYFKLNLTEEILTKKTVTHAQFLWSGPVAPLQNHLLKPNFISATIFLFNLTAHIKVLLIQNGF